jgi:3,4-dihydroxy-9,10-secoandrosta-1,3,5(10)-triene-9,17-dione 4,5-dioxygenase
MGMGHAVFFVDDLDATMAFYTTLLGFRISDYVTMGRTRLGFLHCNPRHHSLAFLHAPGGRKRAHHFMMQLQDINTMGRTYDVVEAGAAPLLTTLGQHSNDQMVSFYMRNPSGFGVEYGWGGLEIDDACWQVQTLEGGSTWGHKPAPR